MDKKHARLRRARKTRARIGRMGIPRLTVYRSGRHLYAQVIDSSNGTVYASASTVQASVKDGLKCFKNIEAAQKVGSAIAERAKKAGLEKVAFDRSGFKYHGRIKALADAAREGGLKF
jgi:large subunit ribosomal protein L18